MGSFLYLLFTLGVFLSLYSVYVGKKAKADGEYRSFCDLSDRTSCSATFKSEYGSHFGISNGIWGAGFYLVAAALYFSGNHQLLFWALLASLGGSAYLAYLFFFKLKKTCLICISIYVINILSFLLILYGME